MSQEIELPPIPEPKNEGPLTPDEFKAFMSDPKSDQRIVQTLAVLHAESSKKSMAIFPMRCALALMLKPKFGPFRMRQKEVDALPPGWDVRFTNTDANGKELKDEVDIHYVAPQERSRGGILLHSGVN